MALAVVCGASGGLGPAVVAGFVKRGDQVVAVARSGDGLARLQGLGDQVQTEQADLSRFDDVEALWSRIDARGQPPRWLVNVTGGFLPGTVIETSPEGYARMHDINLATAWWSSRAAAPRLRRSGAAAIVNVSSRSAVEGGSGAAAYAVMKAAVVKLSQVLADELRAVGIRVNVVLPSLIDTPANRAGMSAAAMRKAVPPEAVAEVILFLCSDAAWAITGAAIPVG